MSNKNSFTDYLSNNQFGSLSPTIGKMVLSQMPQAAYLSSPTGRRFTGEDPTKQRRATPARSRWMQRAYQDIYGDYLGDLGTSLRQGQAPRTFEQFLETDPFTKRYSQLPQNQRSNVTTTNPSTRFIFY